jgi:hypothetical protein
MFVAADMGVRLLFFCFPQFNGCWTFCPDPVSFQSYTTVNIYEDANAYWMSTDKWKRTLRPAIRDHASNSIYPGYGMPLGLVQATQQEVGIKELVMGTHSRSGQQWDIWEAVFSPLDNATGEHRCEYCPPPAPWPL